MKRYLLILPFVLSVALWGLVGWRMAAVTTGRLGPVTTTWEALDQAHPYVAWTPNVAAYTFESGRMRLGAGGVARLLVRPLKHFRTIEIRVDADHDIGLDDEHRDSAKRKSGTESRRIYDLDTLVALDGRYRFTLRGSTTDVGYVRAITVIYRR